jgi:hypothetical protein
MPYKTRLVTFVARGEREVDTPSSQYCNTFRFHGQTKKITKENDMATVTITTKKEKECERETNLQPTSGFARLRHYLALTVFVYFHG